jgi:16S rRNA processing protein RimM
VRDVITTGASDIIVIARDGQDDALIPMVKEFIVALDVAQRRIQIRLIPGLIEGLEDTPTA